MTPKQKAKMIIRRFYTWGINKEGQSLSWFECKELAIIEAEEIEKIAHSDSRANSVLDKEYWEKVKLEIMKL